MENLKPNKLANSADFMMLGEKAFEENVHEKIRETLSLNEKQMWISGYLLALTKQIKQIKIVKDQRDKMFQELIRINGKLMSVKFEDFKEQEFFSDYMSDIIQEMHNYQFNEKGEKI